MPFGGSAARHPRSKCDRPPPHIHHPLSAIVGGLMTQPTRLNPATLVAALFFSVALNAFSSAAPPPLQIHSFDKLDPPSIRPTNFGQALDASNGKVLVGSLGTNAYLYDVATRHELFRLTGSDTHQNDLFGRSVALDQSYALIGASQAHAAYLFDVQTGQQIRKFVDPNAPPSGGGFGTSVAISGHLALIGDPYDETQGAQDGAAYLFDISTGQLLHTFYEGVFGSLHNFGSSVAINGNTIVIGASGTTGNNVFSGAAYVFDATTGAKLHTLLPTDLTTRGLGTSVDIAGTQALVGSSSLTAAGDAYLFDLQTGQEIRRFVSPNYGLGPTETFGGAISFDGVHAFIGSSHESPNGGFREGTSYLFDAQTGSLVASLFPNELAGMTSNFGFSVALAGNTLISGMVSDNNNSDNVYLVSVPEPATTALLIIAGAAASLRRRRMH
jgi:WD40 repeat protein